MSGTENTKQAAANSTSWTYQSGSYQTGGAAQGGASLSSAPYGLQGYSASYQLPAAGYSSYSSYGGVYGGNLAGSRVVGGQLPVGGQVVGQQVLGGQQVLQSRVIQGGFAQGAVAQGAVQGQVVHQQAAQVVQQQPAVVTQNVVQAPVVQQGAAVVQQGVLQSQLVGSSVAQGWGRASIKGESYFEYVPYERTYVEQVAQTRVEYVPVERKITDYYTIEHQTEYVPQTRYETYVDYQPVVSTEYEAVTKTEYVPVEKVEYLPRQRTDYVGVERVEEKVDYQAVQRSVVHGPNNAGVVGGAAASVVSGVNAVGVNAVSGVNAVPAVTKLQGSQLLSQQGGFAYASAPQVYSSNVYSSGPVSGVYGASGYSTGVYGAPAVYGAGLVRPAGQYAVNQYPVPAGKKANSSSSSDAKKRK